TRSEIQLKVDGRSVAIEGFEPPSPTLPDLPRPLPDLPRGRPGLPAPGPGAAPAATAESAPSRYYVAIVSDETSSEQSNRKATYRELFEFLGQGLPADTRFQLMRFDGNLPVVCPRTP